MMVPVSSKNTGIPSPTPTTRRCQYGSLNSLRNAPSYVVLVWPLNSDSMSDRNPFRGCAAAPLQGTVFDLRTVLRSYELNALESRQSLR
jgi:hypothetical protein